MLEVFQKFEEEKILNKVGIENRQLVRWACKGSCEVTFLN